MTRHRIGWALVGLGVVSLIVGVIGLAGGDTPDPGQAVDTTVAGTTAETATTADGTTTSTDITTTTSTTATTTTTMPAETAEEFIGEFAAAVEADDGDFLLSRLHPVVFEIHGEDLCRDWIAEEVVTLSDYEMSGAPEGPVPRTIETPNGTREIDLITVPISFVFQGESFTSTAGLSLVDGVMHWLGECR